MERKAHIINKDAARMGVVKEYDGGRFTIASTASNSWTKALAKYQKKYPDRQLAADSVLSGDVTLQAAAEAILITWEGVTENGQPLPPSYDNKLALLRDAPLFREFVFEASREFANFAAEGEKADTDAVKSPA